MRADVGKFYEYHLLSTGGSPDLLLRALERAKADLDAGDPERFSRRLMRLRRALRLDLIEHRPLVRALTDVLIEAAHAARAGPAEEAWSTLAPLYDAAAAARPWAR